MRRVVVIVASVALVAAVVWGASRLMTARHDATSSQADRAPASLGPGVGTALPAARPTAGSTMAVTAGAVPAYVGSEACATCHPAQTYAWKPSQHARAMAPASPGTVLGRFDGVTFTYAGTTSTFFTRNGRFFVRTDGPDGALADFQIAYTFGVYPLQQYLVAMPGGRLQALSLAWDARPKSAGGARWFHLYPKEAVTSRDPLHWTGIRQNWNFMCADCHATNLRKGYDERQRTFSTTWSELGVGCEACHGPGASHVAWAQPGHQSSDERDKGLTARLDERAGVTWSVDAATGAPMRSRARETEREIEVCARCHARRAQLSDSAVAGEPLENGFRATLLEPGLFRPDGQPRDEVYNYAAFLQSKMHAKGVTCSDCHDPHSGSLRATGNATCTTCHQASRFDAPAHTMHAAGTPAAACATCHMPVSQYMVIDLRHDHSFRVPRPDRTTSLGVPNVCTSACHANRSPAWAAEAIRRSGKPAPVGYQSFAEAFAAPDAGAQLLAVAQNSSLPALVRASALERMSLRSDADVRAVTDHLRDASPMVRRAAASLIGRSDDGTRLATLPRLLADPVRTVRTEAALSLMDLADRALTGPDRLAFDQAFDEFVAEQRFNADRPEAQTNLGQAFMQRSRLDDAQSALTEAIRLDRTFIPAYVNLAEVHRLRRDEASAERVLREAIAIDPRTAVGTHALGLALVRQHRLGDAVPILQRATVLDPSNARYVYVYAVALHDIGRPGDAMRTLRAAAKKWPTDPSISQALRSYESAQ